MAALVECLDPFCSALFSAFVALGGGFVELGEDLDEGAGVGFWVVHWPGLWWSWLTVSGP